MLQWSDTHAGTAMCAGAAFEIGKPVPQRIAKAVAGCAKAFTRGCGILHNARKEK
jgi:hypothetical protein